MKHFILAFFLFFSSTFVFAQGQLTPFIFDLAKDSFEAEWDKFLSDEGLTAPLSDANLKKFLKGLTGNNTTWEQGLAFQFWVNATQYKMTELGPGGCTGGIKVGNIKNMCNFSLTELSDVTLTLINGSNYVVPLKPNGKPDVPYPFNYTPAEFTEGCFDLFFRDYDIPNSAIPLDGGLSFLLLSGLGLGFFRRFKGKAFIKS